MRNLIIYPFLFLCVFFEVSAQDSLKVVTSVVDSYPMLSPNGDKIVFASNRTGSYQIFVCDLDGNNMMQLTKSKGANQTPVWSPDGTKIAFASERDNDSEIYIMNADGTNQIRLTNEPGDDSHPKFSPDGTRIIFNSPRTSPDLSVSWTLQFTEIFTMDLNGNGLKQITTLKSVCTYPSFSPDGKQIVFRQLTKEPGLNWSLDPIKLNSEVFVMNSDGSNIRNVSNSEAFDGWPVWGVDSNSVIFTSNRGGVKNKGQLYRVNVHNSSIEILTPITNSIIQASVSKDGKTIYAQRNWETASYEYGHIVSFPLK